MVNGNSATAVTELLEDVQEDIDNEDWQSALTNLGLVREIVEEMQEKGTQ